MPMSIHSFVEFYFLPQAVHRQESFTGGVVVRSNGNVEAAATEVMYRHVLITVSTR
jgi:hypothetical protein